ncbi:MAG: methyltransferase [Nitrosomonas sp.]|jgi:O-methyltransferase domain/Dimerisation domain|nr:MAG: methyltransferase [Nitrosomonas sp.]
MAQDFFFNMQEPRVDDRPMWDVIFAVYGYPALLLAHKLRLFPLLAEESRTLTDICNALNIKRRPAEAILTVATSLGFLSLQDGRYSLTAISEDYLLEKSPNYFGFFWDLMIDNYQVFSFQNLEKAITTDSPQAYGGGDIFKSHEEQIELLHRFTHGMHSISQASSLVWPTLMDFSRHRMMLDIGGGSGAQSIGAALKLPDLHALVLDFPEACKIAQTYIAQYGVEDRVKTHEANIWNDHWPTADLHFYSHMYHDWPPEKCTFLTDKSFMSLESGGRIILHEILYNDEKTGAFAPAAFSMMMMGWTEGEAYSGPELSEMLKKAGFVDIQVLPAFGYYSLVTGIKP